MAQGILNFIDELGGDGMSDRLGAAIIFEQHA
jgi:hypothetical protein